MTRISTDLHSFAVVKQQVQSSCWHQVSMIRTWKCQHKTRPSVSSQITCWCVFTTKSGCSVAAMQPPENKPAAKTWFGKKSHQSLHLFLGKPQVLISDSSEYRVSMESFGCQIIWWPCHDCTALLCLCPARILALECRAHLGQQSYQ